MPGGVSRAKAGIADQRRPTTISGDRAGRRRSTGPATVSPAPSDEDERERQAPPRVARRPRARASAASGPARPRGSPAGSGPTAIAISGSSPRNTSRQWRVSATTPAMLGPMTPGQDPGGRERGEHPRPQPLRQRPPDRDVGDRRDRAGAEALDDAGGDEDRHRRARARRSARPEREQAEAEQERPGQPAAVDHASRRPRSRAGCRGRTPRRPSRRGRGRRGPSATIGMIVETASASDATIVTFRTSPIVSARRCGDQRLSEGRRRRAAASGAGDRGSDEFAGSGQSVGAARAGWLTVEGCPVGPRAPWTIVDGAATLPVVTVTHEPEIAPPAAAVDRDRPIGIGRVEAIHVDRRGQRADALASSGSGRSPASASRATATRSGPATTRRPEGRPADHAHRGRGARARSPPATGSRSRPAESRRNVTHPRDRRQRARRPAVPDRRRRVRGHAALRAVPVPDRPRRQARPRRRSSIAPGCGRGS